MKNIYVIFFYFILVSLSSCIQEIEINTTNSENGKNIPVLNYTFSPTSKDTCYLSYPHRIDQPIIFESDATIELWQDENHLTDLDNLGKGRYKVPSITNLLPETSYGFKVIKSGTIQAEASDEIPLSVTVDSAFTWSSNSTEDVTVFDFYFQDDEDVEQYYEALFMATSYSSTKDSTSIGFFTFSYIPDLAVDVEGIIPFEPRSIFFSDKTFNGAYYHFNMQMEASVYGSKSLQGKIFEDGYHLIFRTISKNYFDFKKSWVKHRFNQVVQDTLIDIDIEFIFQGEPASLFSNVKNGYGIVAGYQETIVPFIQR